MAPAIKAVNQRHKGAALILSMIFVIVFAALAVSMAAMSGTNVQIASNQHKVNGAFTSAQSGLEILRFWLSRVAIPGTTASDERLDEIAASLQNELTSNDITNLTTYYDSPTITIPTVTLDSGRGQSFSAVITRIDSETLQVNVTGVYGAVARTIRVSYEFGTRAHTVFDFGVASKGPLSLAGNIELEGVNISIESNAYIESPSSLLALSITGNSQIAGDVSIVNPVAFVNLQGGQAGIGGETGQAAIDNHVTFGVPPTEFPAPNPDHFEPFAANVVDCNTDTTADATFENVRILANTNPVFSGHVTLKGVVFIETPNVVQFTGTADVIAVIVGDGSWTDNSAANEIRFLGNVNSQPISELPCEDKFMEIRDETGTFVMAPGFHLSFGGSFTTLSGAVAGNGITFFGNAGGTINGSIINYSDREMALTGNSDLYFNRSGTGSGPAGFVPEIILQYDPTSYSEVYFSS